MMIANQVHPVPTLIGQFRPLQDAVGSPVRASQRPTSKRLIQMVLSRTKRANLRAQKIIHPVIQLLQGSGRALM